MQRDRQTEKQRDIEEIDRQKKTERYIERQTDRQRNRETYRETDRQRNRVIFYRERDNQTHR